MSIIEQLKTAQKAMEGMSADDIKDLMDQAKNTKQLLDDAVRKAVAEEVQKQGFITRDEVRAMIAESRMDH